MIELELDGKKINAEAGSTILEVVLKEGKYVPHFCYHKKLSIAANCRMCLVEVEKSPKPLPACATPITDGMKVHTVSKLAIEAQQGVMEFLLINHPLDCPICDQGGECQLQDIAVGYGRSATRFKEDKRVVTNKELGSLVATEMTRCIHCSRCIRFTEEIAGFQELGMSFRNNHVEVMPFIGQTVNSEISGNIIDICPVGALTSKPFRNQYRSWELSRRKSIAPHDGLGSNIIVQVDKYHKVVRVLPLENEAINECWLSDRDRFSYEGLYHSERTTYPQIKQDNQWVRVDWETALLYVSKSILGVKDDFGSSAVGVLASPTSTTEELYLLQKLMRNLGIHNLDSRLSQSDFTQDGTQNGVNSLGGSIEELSASKSILVIGSILREEQPLLAHRIRHSVKNGGKLNVISVLQEDLLCKVENQITCDPREMVYFLAQVLKAIVGLDVSGMINLSKVKISEKANNIAKSLIGTKPYIILGEIAKSLPDYSSIILLVQELSLVLESKFGILSGRANEVGAGLVGFLPYIGVFGEQLSEIGLNTKQMLDNPCKAYVLFNTELEQDIYNPSIALNALSQAQSVIVMSPYLNETMLKYADVILPITPFTETAGSYVNMQGDWQKFNGVTRPLGEAKPGWKVLRVLANNLQSVGFEYNSIEEVREELANLDNTATFLNNTIVLTTKLSITKPDLSGLVRFGFQGIYSGDSITRRATALQQTKYAQLPVLGVSQKLAKELKLEDNQSTQISQNGISATFKIVICNDLPDTVVLLTANATTSEFGGRYDTIEIKKAQNHG